MSEAPAKPATDKQQRIGSALAVLLTIAIVVVVFWNFRPSGETSRQSDSGDSTTRPDPFGRGRFGMATGIEPAADGWGAGSGPVIMMVSSQKELSFQLRMFGIVDDDTRMAMRMQRSLLNDAGLANSIGLTSEQMEKLRANQPSMIVSEADQDQLKQRWKEWESASASHKPAAQQAVLDALAAAGQKNLEPAKKAWSDAAHNIRNILTLDQMAKLMVYSQGAGPMGIGGPPVAPATQPK